MKDNEIIITVLNKILPSKADDRNQNIFSPNEDTDFGMYEVSDKIKKESDAEFMQTNDFIKHSVFQEVWRTPHPSQNPRKNNLNDSFEELNILR